MALPGFSAENSLNRGTVQYRAIMTFQHARGAALQLWWRPHVCYGPCYWHENECVQNCYYEPCTPQSCVTFTLPCPSGQHCPIRLPPGR